jgi:hypothetical protein
VNTLHQIDPELSVFDEATMNEKIDGTQAALLHRFSAWLVGYFDAKFGSSFGRIVSGWPTIWKCEEFW